MEKVRGSEGRADVDGRRSHGVGEEEEDDKRARQKECGWNEDKTGNKRQRISGMDAG